MFKVSCWISACPRLSLTIRPGDSVFPRWTARHAYGPEGGQSAADWLANVKEAELARVLKELGEERFARRIASKLMHVERGPFSGPPILLKLSRPLTQSGNRTSIRQPGVFKPSGCTSTVNWSPARRVECCAVGAGFKGGRLVVISFHSLEDRIVKRLIRNASRGRQLPGCAYQFLGAQVSLKPIGKLSCRLRLRWRSTLEPDRRSCE